MSLTGTLLPTPLQPGSPAWLRTMSASKIAAVAGLSPYESRFSLWHRMAGHLADEQTDAHRRGHYLEPAIRNWFADQHPEWAVTLTGTWAHECAPWMTASPDGLVDGAELLEIKTAADPDGWGKPGTDEIPVGYRAQVQWQLLVTGAKRCHVAVLLPYLSFAEYVVDADTGEQRYLTEAAEAFMASLPGGPLEQRPNLDDHAATFTAVRELHPGIDGTDAEVPPPLADRYCTALAAHKAADAERQAATTALADHMGTAKRALTGDLVLARRQAKGTGLPYLVAGKNLPATLGVLA